MRLLASAVAAALTLAVSPAALAADGTPRVDARQETQLERIGRGWTESELTARELRTLGRQQRAIEGLETRAAEDGAFSARERVGLELAQDRASRTIGRFNRNGRDR